MKKIIVTCDRCGKDISLDKQQKCNLQIRYACDKELYEGGASTTKQVTWCRECFELSGLISPSQETVKAINDGQGLSLEDMIREIVRETIEATP